MAHIGIAQTNVTGQAAGGGGGGSGTVTSVGLVGTANQITVTGSSPITTSGSWTLSLPNTLDIGVASSAAGSIVLNQTTAYATTVTGAATTNWTLTLPATAGSSGQFLQTNGSGTTSWANDMVQSVTVTLTSAQILALNTTTVNIIPAQGAGTVIVPVMACGELIYGTTTYAATGGTQGLVFHGNTTSFCSGMGTTIKGTANAFGIFPVAAIVDQALSVGSNVGVDMYSSNALTTGNGTFKLTVWYVVMTL